MVDHGRHDMSSRLTLDEYLDEYPPETTQKSVDDLREVQRKYKPSNFAPFHYTLAEEDEKNTIKNFFL